MICTTWDLRSEGTSYSMSNQIWSLQLPFRSLFPHSPCFPSVKTQHHHILLLQPETLQFCKECYHSPSLSQSSPNLRAHTHRDTLYQVPFVLLLLYVLHLLFIFCLQCPHSIVNSHITGLPVSNLSSTSLWDSLSKSFFKSASFGIWYFSSSPLPTDKTSNL